MAEISAAAVKAFREKTGLPLMDCKKALQDAGGDEAKAIDILRKEGKKLEEKRSGRETSLVVSACTVDSIKKFARWSSCCAKAHR